MPVTEALGKQGIHQNGVVIAGAPYDRGYEEDELKSMTLGPIRPGSSSYYRVNMHSLADDLEAGETIERALNNQGMYFDDDRDLSELRLSTSRLGKDRWYFDLPAFARHVTEEGADSTGAEGVSLVLTEAEAAAVSSALARSSDPVAAAVRSRLDLARFE